MANPQDLPTNKQIEYYFEDNETNIILEIANRVLDDDRLRELAAEYLDLSDDALIEISSKLKKILHG